jgi:hypothetical protein
MIISHRLRCQSGFACPNWIVGVIFRCLGETVAIGRPQRFIL